MWELGGKGEVFWWFGGGEVRLEEGEWCVGIFACDGMDLANSGRLGGM